MGLGLELEDIGYAIHNRGSPNEYIVFFGFSAGNNRDYINKVAWTDNPSRPNRLKLSQRVKILRVATEKVCNDIKVSALCFFGDLSYGPYIIKMLLK